MKETEREQSQTFIIYSGFVCQTYKCEYHAKIGLLKNYRYCSQNDWILTKRGATIIPQD